MKIRKTIILLCTACLFQAFAGAAPIPDIQSVEADLIIPALSDKSEEPKAGMRFRYVHPKWEGTGIYAAVYLPTDWKPGEKFPVIVELPGTGGYKNRFGDTCNGRPEGCKLGYGVSGGKGVIWVCLPFVKESGKEMAMIWWGDKPRYRPNQTVTHTHAMVEKICRTFGGDRDRVILAGFSRGAIACNFIGLHDDGIAKLWCGMIVYSHYDGVHKWPYPGSDREAAVRRLAGLGGIPQFICHETDAKKNSNLEATKKYLAWTGHEGNFTFASTGFRNHNDAWVLRPSPARDRLRAWLKSLIK